MNFLTVSVGVVGGCLCVAAHLPGRLRCWGPHAIALTVMLQPLLTGPTNVSWAGVAAAAVAAVWTAIAAPPDTGRAAPALDLVAMAFITACTTLSGGGRSTDGPMPSTAMSSTAMPSMPVPPHSLGPGFALLLVACWAAARSSLRLGFLLGGGPAPAPGRSARTRLRDLGSAAMIVSMAAMLL
jgi:hypothetical protein